MIIDLFKQELKLGIHRLVFRSVSATIQFSVVKENAVMYRLAYQKTFMAHISQLQGIELKNFPRQLVNNEKAHSRNTFIFHQQMGKTTLKSSFITVFIHRDETKNSGLYCACSSGNAALLSPIREDGYMKMYKSKSTTKSFALCALKMLYHIIFFFSQRVAQDFAPSTMVSPI